jgi:organic radical activating enzyme
MISLAPQGVFWTVQGEGHLAGEPMVFVRLAGCSVNCPQCDTNYVHHSYISAQEVVGNCVAARDANKRAEYVWITGGEPTNQELGELRDGLWAAGFKPCLATSGVREVSGSWWWISVSPHSADFVQRAGHELKLVPGLNGLKLQEIDTRSCSFGRYYVQPMAGSRESLESCLQWLKSHPQFKLSPQSHKSWGLP